MLGTCNVQASDCSKQYRSKLLHSAKLVDVSFSVFAVNHWSAAISSWQLHRVGRRPTALQSLLTTLMSTIMTMLSFGAINILADAGFGCVGFSFPCWGWCARVVDQYFPGYNRDSELEGKHELPNGSCSLLQHTAEQHVGVFFRHPVGLTWTGVDGCFTDQFGIT